MTLTLKFGKKITQGGFLKERNSLCHLFFLKISANRSSSLQFFKMNIYSQLIHIYSQLREYFKFLYYLESR